MIEMKYTQNGDYLFPEMGLTETDQMPLGKYGMMRQDYLENHRPGLYARMLLGGTLMMHLTEIQHTATKRLNILLPQLAKQNGVTEELKARDPMQWVAQMNSLKAQVEELIYTELIYV